MRSAFANRLINIAACAAIGAALMAGAGVGKAAASASQLVAEVSLSRQSMQVAVDGRVYFEWTVSTGASGYATPKGSYRPTRMHEMWHSRKYDNAPMPHSVFFHGGYAVHATPHVRHLGQPASHGCVRLHPDNAHDFFELVETFGPGNTRIVVKD